MSTAAVPPQTPVIDHAKRRQAVLIILAGTLLVAVAQMLIKSGANRLAESGHTGLIGLYAVFAVMMIYSLKHGEMSVLFPLISLGFVWVTILSVFIFHESMSPLKGAGIAIIVAGVAVLGRGGSH